MKILVVHRQNEIVAVIKSVLARCLPVVRYTDSGLDGLLTSRIEKFDLIICGTDLPVVTGFELVRSLRTYSINKDVPVVFITDEWDDKTRILSNALGAVATMIHGDSENLEDVILREFQNDNSNFSKAIQQLVS